MNLIWALLTGFLVTLAFSLQAAQTASATFFCWSLRFYQGQGSLGGTLDLSTIVGTPNGELAPWYATYTHQTGISLVFSNVSMTGTLFLNLPPNPDANGNGIDDSYEVSQAVNATSQGQYANDSGRTGKATATWRRAAGARTGTCGLHLVDDAYGDLGTYLHTFTVLQYTGALTYTPGTNTVSGSLNLTNQTDQLRGPATFVKSLADPHNLLTLRNVFLTNTALRVLTLYTNNPFYRNQTRGTNYYGEVDFVDGDFSTVAEDYFGWQFTFDDRNDTNHNGIPDFSDDLVPLVPRRPKLSLARGATNLVLTVSGSVGHLHDIQSVTNVNATNWQTVASLTLTNDPQTVSLPLPATPKFWRAVAH